MALLAAFALCFWRKTNEKLAEMLANALGRAIEDVPCAGCRALDGKPHVLGGQVCNTYACIEEKGHAYCFECDQFPCENLTPCIDQAQRLPHNMKVYNLVLLQKEGVDEFMKNAARRLNRYYKGQTCHRRSGENAGRINESMRFSTT